MGADGGIIISKVDDIKKDWSKIKQDLITSFEYRIKRAESWEIKYAEENLAKSKELPDDISSYTGEDIIKMFDYLKSCDCPYLFEGFIITGNGDYVTDSMNILSSCLRSLDSSVDIETWT